MIVLLAGQLLSGRLVNWHLNITECMLNGMVMINITNKHQHHINQRRGVHLQSSLPDRLMWSLMEPIFIAMYLSSEMYLVLRRRLRDETNTCHTRFLQSINHLSNRFVIGVRIATNMHF